MYFSYTNSKNQLDPLTYHGGNPVTSVTAKAVIDIIEEDDLRTNAAVVGDYFRKKLEELPLKWTNYFRVNRNLLEVPAGSTKKANLSEKCSLEVKNVGHSLIEVSLFGKGEQVVKRTQAMPKGETLALGGNAPNATSWFVVLKRVD